MKRQKLIVLSVDALVYEDLEFLKDQPGMPSLERYLLIDPFMPGVLDIS